MIDVQTINLRDYYYELYTKDTFIEVSDEVAAALLRMKRDENNWKKRMYYHKAYFSLDAGDGIENDAIDFLEASPEDILIAHENEEYAKLLIERLYDAINHLTPAQARRLYAKRIMGRRVSDIAKEEGVCEVSVYDSINNAVLRLKEYFKKKKWKEYEE